MFACYCYNMIIGLSSAKAVPKIQTLLFLMTYFLMVICFYEMISDDEGVTNKHIQKGINFQ